MHLGMKQWRGTMLKLYTEVKLTDGAEGTIIGAYTNPSEGYDIDTADDDGTDRYGDGGWRTVRREDIMEVLRGPQ